MGLLLVLAAPEAAAEQSTTDRDDDGDGMVESHELLPLYRQRLKMYDCQRI